MAKKKINRLAIVEYSKNHLTDWIINGTHYGLGIFNNKNKDIPVDVYSCISVNNAQWDWTFDSYMSWEVAEALIKLFKKYDKYSKKRRRVAIGKHLMRIEPVTTWKIH